MTNTFFSGWDPKSEDWKAIEGLPTGLGFDPADVEPLPKAMIPPSEWLRIELQRRNDCAGHMLSTILEVNHYNATGEIVQLSRHAAYILSQKLTGGGRCSDNGAMIAAAVKLAEGYGVCSESDYPYPGEFTCRISQSQIDAGLPYRTKESRRLTSPEEVRDWVKFKKGAVAAGVPWGGGGYHAIPYLQADDQTSDFANSHGSSYGAKGWGKDTLRELGQRFRGRYSVFIGMSWTESTPTFDWAKHKDWGMA